MLNDIHYSMIIHFKLYEFINNLIKKSNRYKLFSDA